MNVAAHAHVVITAVFYLWKLVVVSIIFFYLLFFLYFFCILFRFSLEELNMLLRLYIELYSGIRKCFGKLLRDVNHNGNYLKLAKKRWTRMYRNRKEKRKICE